MIGECDLRCLKTCLSDDVFNLIHTVNIKQEHKHSVKNCITENFTFNWDVIESILCEEKQNSDYYKESITNISPIVNYVHSFMFKWTCDDFSNHYGSFIEWTHQVDLLYTCFKLCSIDDNTENQLISILTITAMLERSMGNVHLLKNSKCPNMLKDILLSDFLEIIFGSKILQFLRIFVGPPISLNLRNISWHGYLSSIELPKCFIYTLFCIVASLGEVLLLNDIKPRDIIPRSFIDYSEISIFHNIFPILDNNSVSTVLNIFQESKFISRHMINLWVKSIKLVEEKSYGLAVCLILPLIENLLRAIYILSNNLPHKNMLAQNNVLFITLDNILDEKLPSNTSNNIASNISVEGMSLLMDVFQYLEGPRLRDKMSHGEVDVFEIQDVFSNHLLCLCIFIISKFEQIPLQNELINQIVTCGSRYESLCHPLSSLKSKLMKLPNHVQTCMKLLISNELDLNSDNVFGDVYVHLKQMLKLENCCLFEFQSLTIDTICQTVGKQKISTLYRCSDDESSDIDSGLISELELVTFLNRLSHVSSLVLQQIVETVEEWNNRFEAKTLRSRQRKTYVNMKNSLPLIINAFEMIYYVLLNLYFPILHHSRQISTLAYKYMKFLLQCLENLLTFTHINKNKWDESVKLIEELISRTMDLNNIYK